MKVEHTPIEVPSPGSDFQTIGGKWFAAGPPVTASQGWKLYISAARPNFLETLSSVRAVFDRHAIHYKYVSSDRVLRKLNAGLYGYSQVGKNIVGYVENEATLRQIVAELKSALRRFADTAPSPPLAIPIGGALPISYRFGAFHSDAVVVDGESISDERSRPASWIFEHLADPLEDLREPVPVDQEFDEFLAGFPVYETLAQGGKGGIFAAFDLAADAFDDLILKIGYRNGQILPDGRDGMSLIEAEAQFFRLLADEGLDDCAPQLRSYRRFRDRAVLVMERIEGESLMSHRLAGTLTVSHVRDCLALLSRIHAAGLYVGDAKLANFIADDKNGGIRAIDFEAAGKLNSARLDVLCTFQFSSPAFPDMATLERCHLLYSAIHVDEGNTFSESDRIIDLSRLLPNLSVEGEASEWALDQLRAELSEIV